MKIFVGGSLRENAPMHADQFEQFIVRLGELIVERDHILLTGCRGSLDKTIAEAAGQWLEKNGRDPRKQIVSYRLKNDEPAHRVGRIQVSKRMDWELTHPDLDSPEQIADADVTVFVAGGEGTFFAANWARISRKPVLGVVQFGGAGELIYEKEREQFGNRYAHLVTMDEFDILNQDTDDINQLAEDILALCENLVIPNTVFIIMPFKEEFDELYSVYKTVCSDFGFEAVRTDKVFSLEKILPRILNGIRHSAFVIADVTETSPNVFYEVGFAEGLGRPIITTAKKDTKLPFDIADTPVTFWSNPEDLKAKLESTIQEIKSGLGKGYKTSA
jgi:predicted Rossmann-fold nucleotide-binding protein